MKKSTTIQYEILEEQGKLNESSTSNNKDNCVKIPGHTNIKNIEVQGTGNTSHANAQLDLCKSGKTRITIRKKTQNVFAGNKITNDNNHTAKQRTK